MSHNDKRVFVLGAGFSASAGLPLSSTFFEQWMRWMQEVSDRDFQRLTEQIRFLAFLYLSPTRRHKFNGPGWHKDIDIERLLSVAEATTPFWRAIAAPRDAAARRLGDLGRDLLEHFKRSVSQFLFRESTAPTTAMTSIRSFAQKLRRGDIVLTFNWDTLLERALKERGKPYVLWPSDQSAVTILKLHGSMDWLRESTPAGRAEVLTEVVAGRIRRIKDYAAFMDVRGASFVPYLVPPSAYKRYDPDLFQLWKAAHQAVYDATEVVVIGYSLPLTDWVSAALLRLPFRPELIDVRRQKPAGKRLWVVDPNPDIVARYRQQITASAQSGVTRASAWGWSVAADRGSNRTGQRRT